VNLFPLPLFPQIINQKGESPLFPFEGVKRGIGGVYKTSETNPS
jgi:hypothetical protein